MTVSWWRFNDTSSDCDSMLSVASDLDIQSRRFDLSADIRSDAVARGDQNATVSHNSINDDLVVKQHAMFIWHGKRTAVCSGSVVVTAYDSESGRPGSNPEWGAVYYEASITAQGLPEPSSLRAVHWVPEQLNIKAVTGACKLIDGCSLALCSATVLVVSAGICHRNKVNSTA